MALINPGSFYQMNPRFQAVDAYMQGKSLADQFRSNELARQEQQQMMDLRAAQEAIY